MQLILEVVFQFIFEYLFDKYKKMSWKLFFIFIPLSFTVLWQNSAQPVWWKLLILAAGISMLITVFLLLLWHICLKLWKLKNE